MTGFLLGCLALRTRSRRDLRRPGFRFLQGALGAVPAPTERRTDDIADASKAGHRQYRTTRFVVDKVLSLRQAQWLRALDYWGRWQAPRRTVQLTEAAYDAQVKLINSAAAYYGARTNASGR